MEQKKEKDRKEKKRVAPLPHFSGSKDCEEEKRGRNCWLEREGKPAVSPRLLGALGRAQQVSDIEVQREEANATPFPG